MESYRYATFGPDLEKLGFTYSKIMPSDVSTLVDEFFELQLAGPSVAQKSLQEQFRQRFEVTQEIGCPSTMFKPNYLKA